MEPGQVTAEGGKVITDALRDTALLDRMAEHIGLVALLVAVFYVIAAICAVREIMNSRTAQGTIAWLLSLFFLPYLTVPLYFVFGWRSFEDYMKVRSDLGRESRTRRAAEVRLADKKGTDYWPVLSKVAGVPFLAGNACDLLIDGEATFASILEGIAAAQQTILVQFYIFKDDQIGRQFADALIERAQAGVTVYFLYDEIGSNELPNSYLARLREAGIKVSGFNEQHKFLRFLGPMRLNYRNHRKIVVTDYKTAWVGGMNVADEYLGRVKKFGHWRDTHVKVSGPAAIGCAISLAEDWKWANGSDIPLPAGNEIEQPGDEPVLVMPSGPADELEECAIAFAEAAGRARKRFWVVTPYFVPSIDIQIALYAAAMRGVDVRILLPEKADHTLVWLASYAHADAMIDRGVKVYRYKEGFLHQKVTLVDDELASIGTVNFDNRSFRINFEITLWFTHKRMIDKVEKMLETDFANAVETSADDLKNRNYAFRVVSQAAQLFSPVL